MKKLLIVFAVLTATFAVNASYLYWTVGDTVTLDDGNTWSSGSHYTHAAVYGVKNGAWTMLAGYEETSTSGSIDLGTTAYDSMVIELFKYDSGTYNSVAKKESAYTDVAAYFHNSSLELAGVAASAMWNGNPYHAVPEPTSGLMVMLGMALLGLKRKRA